MEAAVHAANARFRNFEDNIVDHRPSGLNRLVSPAPVLHTPPRSVNGGHAALESVWQVDYWGRQLSTSASSKLNIWRETVMSNFNTRSSNGSLDVVGEFYPEHPIGSANSIA